MANYKFIPIDTDKMEEGTFYQVQTNKNNATALIKVDLLNPEIKVKDLSEDFSVDTNGKIYVNNSIPDLVINSECIDIKISEKKLFKGTITANIMDFFFELSDSITFSIDSIHIESNSSIQEVPNMDYLYSKDLEMLRVNFGNYRGIYEIIITFYKI